MEEIEFADDLWQILIRTFHVMRRARQKELNKYGITTRTSAVLGVVIRLGEKATLTNIARQLVLEDHSMSEQLARMEKTGLVTKVKGRSGTKQILVELTEKGREAYEQSMERKSIRKIMSVLSQEEKRAMYSMAARIREASLQELGKEVSDIYPPENFAELESARA